MIQYKDSSEWNDLCEYRKYDEVDFDTVEEDAEVTESIESVKVDDHLWQVKYSGDTSLELDGEREVMYIPFKEPLEPRVVLEVYDEEENFVADDSVNDEITEVELSSDSLAVNSFETRIIQFEREGLDYSKFQPAVMYSATGIVSTYVLLTNVIPENGLVSLESALFSFFILIAVILLPFSVLGALTEIKFREKISNTEEVCRIE